MFISKGSKDVDVIDMPESIKQLKKDKIIQDALIVEFNTLNKDKQYDVWIKSKLKVGSKKIDFTIESRQYVEYNISLTKEISTLSFNLP